MASAYHDGSRRLQDRFDTRRLADRLDERFVQRGLIDAGDRAFIERMDMFFLATADADGRPAVLVQGRRARLRPRARRAHRRVPQLRRQRHVPVDGQRARQPARRAALHRLQPSARRGCGSTAWRASTRTTRCWRVPRGAVRRARARDAGLPELPALHPPHGARRALALRAARGRASRRCRTGSAPTGPATCCRRDPPRDELRPARSPERARRPRGRPRCAPTR